MEWDARALYSVPPGAFVANRNRLAADARDAGDRELAARIRGLRRPTISAWAVNLLAHRETERLDGLLDIGARLRRAWAEGTALGEPERRRRELIAELVGRARSHAAGTGHPVREEALREVEETLHAATVDARAAEEVRAGTLTRTLSHAGFATPGSPSTGPAPDSAAAPGPRVTSAPPRRRGPPPEERRLRLRRLRVELDNAAERAASAARDEAEWTSEVERAETELAAADDAIERLRRRLRERESARSGTERQVRLAWREHDRARRSADAARRRADDAARRWKAADDAGGPEARSGAEPDPGSGPSAGTGDE